MTRKKQANNENGAVLKRDFPKRSRSLIIGAEELRRLFPNVKTECAEKKAEIAEEKAKLKEGAD